MNVYLCGFMGCGKSTVGKVLAKKLGKDFVDLDGYIEQKNNMTIKEIFEREGEARFRKMETESLAELCEADKVIATGGGALASTQNAIFSRKYGKIIFIDTSFPACYERIIKNRQRPLALMKTKHELFDLFKKRIPYYITHSDYQVDGNNSPDEISNEIIDYLKKQL